MQENILIINSCNITRQAYESILSQQYELLFADTAQKGLSLISNNVRLTFLDMALPDASGLEVVLAIKQNHPSIPIVMTTSNGSEEKCLAAFRGGARDYIKKPLIRDEIIQTTEKLMNITPHSQRRRHISLLVENELHWDKQDIPQRIFEGISRVADHIIDNCASCVSGNPACITLSQARF